MLFLIYMYVLINLCFVVKELMLNTKVRKGFLSAVLNIKDTNIKEIILENTNLRVRHEYEKH